MKILTLDLAAYGPFTKTKIKFADGVSSFNIIYGPNEAGKSSALRAITSLLYGIEQQSNDNFLHSYPSLRIGGILEHSDNTRLEIWRRKGTKNTLLNSTGQSIADTTLKHFLDDASQNFFQTLFGLDHVRLREGGREIMAGSGQVGAALFAAGTGLLGLRHTASILQTEADALFKARAQSPLINELIKRCRDLKKTRDSQILHGTKWQTQLQALQHTKNQLAELNTQIQNQRAQQARLERIAQALPEIAHQETLHNKLAEFADTIILPEDFPQRRISAMERLANSQREIENIQQILAKLQLELQKLNVDHALLRLKPEIERLVKIAGATEKAAYDLNNLKIRNREHEANAYKALQELRPDLTLTQATSELSLPKAQRDGIRELGNQYNILIERHTKATAMNRELQGKIKKQRKILAELGSIIDTTNLKRSCYNAQLAGDIDTYLTTARNNLAFEQDQVAIALRQLSGWSHDLEALMHIALPNRETIDIFHDDFVALGQQHNNLKMQFKTANTALIETQRQLDALRLEIAVPTEDDLYSARQKRDAKWDLICQIWQKPKIPNANFQDSPPNTEFDIRPDNTLLKSYQQLVAITDTLADRLRREAERVQQQARAKADATFHRTTLTNLEQALASIIQRRNQREQEWRALWEPLGISSYTPKEMRSWLQNAEALRNKAMQLRKSQIEVAELTTRFNSLQTDLIANIRNVSEQSTKQREPNFTKQDSPAQQDQNYENQTLKFSIGQAQAIIQHQDQLYQQRQQLQANLAELEYNLQQTEQAIITANNDLHTWQQRWAKAIAILGLEPQASPSQANIALSKLEDLFEALDKAAGLAKRIHDIEQDQSQFAAMITNISVQIAPNLKNQPALTAINSISINLQDAQTNLVRYNTLTKQITTEQKRLEQIRLNYQKAQDQINACLQDAQCTQIEDLLTKETNSQKRQKLETDLAACNRRLRELAAGKSEDALITAASQIDPDTLPGHLAQLEIDIQALEEQRLKLNQTLGHTQAELEYMENQDNAATTAETLEQTLAELRNAGEQYLKLRLASAVLAQQIETYRQQHQTPLLQRAGVFFAQLTSGAFVGLEATFGADDQQVLQAVRADRTSKLAVAGMSDGTRDQLFLALRLASIESYVQHAEPIPLIVDDILIHYDDVRSRATLQTLANFAKNTQVIMFTHHQHLLQLAREALEPNQLWIQELA
ncbi:hypothetical protein TI05_07560 [Achromatium sp. WMS3]|nr:hypothetical protein TI05_07560 [Achromatium sp. WMS3]